MIRKRFFEQDASLAWLRISAVVITLFAAKNFFMAVIHWEKMRGWEAYWIAQAIASGEGYSFPSEHRWLFDAVADGGYHPTAWIDPLYTYILAGFIWLFGDYHQLAAALFNLLLYLAIFALLYHLAARLISHKAAVLAVLLLALSDITSIPSAMNNTWLATTFILVSVVALVHFFEMPSVRRAVMLGAALGFTVLTSPGAQYFIPVVAITIVFWGRRDFKSALLHTTLVSVISVAIIAPWTIRNYLLFDEFIPVRSGAGQFVFIGFVAAAATVMPEKIASTTKPDWNAKTVNEAVWNIGNHIEAKRSLVKFQLKYAKEVVGKDQWRKMNEAQRDKWFFREAKKFIHDNPFISLQLAKTKMHIFVRRMGRVGVLIMLLAVLGALVTLKNPAVSTMALWVSVYIGPFFLVIAYYGRYRSPVEPLLTLLAVFAIDWIFSKIRQVRSTQIAQSPDTS